MLVARLSLVDRFWRTVIAGGGAKFGMDLGCLGCNKLLRHADLNCEGLKQVVETTSDRPAP